MRECKQRQGVEGDIRDTVDGDDGFTKANGASGSLQEDGPRGRI
jgi:hypothetical protein